MTDRTITVEGTATRTVDHEHVTVTLRTHAEAEDAATARERAADAAATLRSELEERGLPREAVETSTFRLAHRSERHDASADDPAYRAEETLVVTCEPDQPAETVAAGAAAGASVGSIRPGVSEETRASVAEAALEEAVRDARETAETVAAADGEAAGRLRSVETTSRTRKLSGPGDPVAAADLHEIRPGPVEIERSVTATFDLAD